MNGSHKKMNLFASYNRLLYPQEVIGWYAGRRKTVVIEPTSDEYDVLLSILTHKKARLRWMAANRLGKIRDDRAVEPLIKALMDEHWLVRLQAVKALGCIGTSTCFDALVAKVHDSCHYVRRATMRALKKENFKKDPRVTEALLSVLQGSDEGAQIDAIEYLTYTPSPAVIVALTEAAVRDHGNNVAREVLSAFATIGSPAVVGVEKLLEHPNKETRFHAAIILGYRGHKRAIQYLEEATLDGADAKLRESTESFLSEFRKRYPDI